MLKSAVAHVLASVILLSQIGLPLHLHYCKGALESVSVFFQNGCDDHQTAADLPACCQKMADVHCTTAGHCTQGDNNCCDDQVRILSQDLDSLKPHFLQWTDLAFEYSPVFSPETIAPEQEQQYSSLPVAVAVHGPPKYILHHALVLYA